MVYATDILTEISGVGWVIQGAYSGCHLLLGYSHCVVSLLRIMVVGTTYDDPFPGFLETEYLEVLYCFRHLWKP